MEAKFTITYYYTRIPVLKIAFPYLTRQAVIYACNIHEAVAKLKKYDSYFVKIALNGVTLEEIK